MFLRRWLTKTVFHTHHGAFINAVCGRLSACLHYKITRLAVEITWVYCAANYPANYTLFLRLAKTKDKQYSTKARAEGKPRSAVAGRAPNACMP